MYIQFPDRRNVVLQDNSIVHRSKDNRVVGRKRIKDMGWVSEYESRDLDTMTEQEIDDAISRMEREAKIFHDRNNPQQH